VKAALRRGHLGRGLASRACRRAGLQQDPDRLPSRIRSWVSSITASIFSAAALLLCSRTHLYATPHNVGFGAWRRGSRISRNCCGRSFRRLLPRFRPHRTGIRTKVSGHLRDNPLYDAGVLGCGESPVRLEDLQLELLAGVLTRRFGRPLLPASSPGCSVGTPTGGLPLGYLPRKRANGLVAP
jgi:hypothetical protein